MSWGQEIIRALFLALGVTEAICNTIYLFRKKGLNAARRQHSELPKNISDQKIKVKVICMLISGLLLFTAALASYLSHEFLTVFMVGVAVCFSIYGITEALYYKYWKTAGFACVTILIAAVTVIVSL